MLPRVMERFCAICRFHLNSQVFHAEYLESGAVGYQCNDMMGEAARLGNGCDCIHAIADMDPLYPRWRYPLAFYGPAATANLVRRFMHSPVTIDARQTHDWLICRLGLNEYPMERRTYRGRIDPYVPGKAGLQDGPTLPLPQLPARKLEADPVEKKP